jgi:hypothetical protein
MQMQMQMQMQQRQQGGSTTAPPSYEAVEAIAEQEGEEGGGSIRLTCVTRNGTTHEWLQQTRLQQTCLQQGQAPGLLTMHEEMESTSWTTTPCWTLRSSLLGRDVSVDTGRMDATKARLLAWCVIVTRLQRTLQRTIDPQQLPANQQRSTNNDQRFQLLLLARSLPSFLLLAPSLLLLSSLAPPSLLPRSSLAERR